MSFDRILELIMAVIGLATLIALTWNIVLVRKQLQHQQEQLKNQQKQLCEDHEWRRRNESIKYSTLHHPKVKECRTILDEHFRIFTRESAIPLPEIEHKFQEKPELRTDTNYLLTYYENIAIACNNHIVDPGIIKDMMKGSLIDVKTNFQIYIEHRRRQSGNKLLWINLTDLAEQWESSDSKPNKKEPLGQ